MTEVKLTWGEFQRLRELLSAVPSGGYYVSRGALANKEGNVVVRWHYFKDLVVIQIGVKEANDGETQPNP